MLFWWKYMDFVSLSQASVEASVQWAKLLYYDIELPIDLLLFFLSLDLPLCASCWYADMDTISETYLCSLYQVKSYKWPQTTALRHQPATVNIAQVFPWCFCIHACHLTCANLVYQTNPYDYNFPFLYVTIANLFAFCNTNLILFLWVLNQMLVSCHTRSTSFVSKWDVHTKMECILYTCAKGFML